ncbi:MAG: spore coat protein CotJB [Clostridium sp.]|nr:spore coat protein CotJB [Clostridium sp.]
MENNSNVIDNRNQLLNKIRQLKFAAVDLNLYLDTHPDNEKALEDYNTISELLTKSISFYETNYGPLINFGSSQSKFPWQWTNEPWPWEIGE